MYGSYYSTNYVLVIVAAVVFTVIMCYLLYREDKEHKINAKRRAKYSCKSRYEK